VSNGAFTQKIVIFRLANYENCLDMFSCSDRTPALVCERQILDYDYTELCICIACMSYGEKANVHSQRLQQSQVYTTNTV